MCFKENISGKSTREILFSYMENKQRLSPYSLANYQQMVSIRSYNVLSVQMLILYEQRSLDIL